jgi:KUP system potassium uptake protein
MTQDSRRKSLHEGAKKVELRSSDGAGDGNGGDDGGAAAKRPSFNEAAHKQAYWETTVRLPSRLTSSKGSGRFADGGVDGDVVAHAGKAVLALGALGVVYGDIGTSPLYTEQVIFTAHAKAAQATPAGVYGITSLIFWSLMIVVSIKYAGFIMRAHNRGDGGIMALTALISRHKVPRKALLITLGIFGASLFFGDGMITPAISVLSAVEGLNVATPALSHLILPISLAILLGLFLIQSRGTGMVGWLFGPVMLLWFSVLAVLGLHEVIMHPGVLQGLAPSWGARFMVNHGFQAFLTLGGVVLCVTGAEALYADRGHFGPHPIRLAWFLVVLPGVLLNYLGQGALILAHPQDRVNPFYLLAPKWGVVPLVILATVATVIASQAVISGSYSVARQAAQIGFLPRLKVVHTSMLEGQIYVPIINWALCIGVVTLILAFQHSAKLADAYGVAVTGTFILNTLLFLAIARAMWHTPKWKLACLGTLFLTVEIAFFTSNLAKIFHGAWLPLAVGLLVSLVMITWRNGREIVTRNRIAQEGPLDEFLQRMPDIRPPVKRVPGTAVFLNPSKDTTPLALRAEIEHVHVLQEKVVIVSVETVSVPHIERADQFTVDLLGRGSTRIVHVAVRFGYQDPPDVPRALRLARKGGLLERNLDLEHASYFVSRITITPSDESGLKSWRKRVFVTMARNAASPIDHFRLPGERTVMMGSQVPV